MTDTQTFIVRETYNDESGRRGETVMVIEDEPLSRLVDRIEASNLNVAKRQATKMQAFSHTVMNVEDVTGRILAVKKGKTWHNVDTDSTKQSGLQHTQDAANQNDNQQGAWAS